MKGILNQYKYNVRQYFSPTEARGLENIIHDPYSYRKDQLDLRDAATLSQRSESKMNCSCAPTLVVKPSMKKVA
jgi:hypothetical protein